MLKLVTNFVNGKKLGVKAQGFTEGSREKLAEAPATFISVDNTRALDTMGELGHFKVVRKVVLPKLSKEFADGCAVEGEEVLEILTLRLEER